MPAYCPDSMLRVLFEPERPADAAGDVCPKDRIVAPDIGAMAECGVEHASLAECPFPGLRVVAAPRHFRQVAEVAPFGVDAQEDVDAVPRE